MQKAPVLKSSGLAPIDDGTVHVFGRNLEERVVAREEESSKDEAVEHRAEDDVETIKKRKFETITGEEDEETAFQGEFKLFIWDLSTSNWIERGRGQLKLNDTPDSSSQKSRLIMRTGGTFRIILNVAIQHPHFRVIAKNKTNIRFTDSQSVWAASGSNAKLLGDLIDHRLKIDELNNVRNDIKKLKKKEEEGHNDVSVKRGSDVDRSEGDRPQEQAKDGTSNDRQEESCPDDKLKEDPVRDKPPEDLKYDQPVGENQSGQESKVDLCDEKPKDLTEDQSEESSDEVKQIPIDREHDVHVNDEKSTTHESGSGSNDEQKEED